MHASYIRPGGLAQDVSDSLLEDINVFTKSFSLRLKEIEELLTNNRIWNSRLRTIGIISLKEALNWGFSGPMIRSAGLAWDLRAVAPYSVYNLLDFYIPVGASAILMIDI